MLNRSRSETIRTEMPGVAPSRWTVVVFAAVASALLILSGLIAPKASADVAGPRQPVSGPGSQGPCGIAPAIHVNPEDVTQKIAVYNPTGTARTPVTGGHCNDGKRPVVYIMHGLAAGIDAQIMGVSLLYWDIIQHYTSTGNVVVFVTWPTNPYDFDWSFKRGDRNVAIARKYAPRGDFSRLGFVGHSMGGGLVPYIAERAVARGWGKQSLWALQLAPAFAANIGTGPIDLPDHARVLVVNFDNDNILDTRLGIEQYRAYNLPAANKRHILIRSDDRGLLARLDATHLSSNTLLAPNDAIKFYGIYRNGDALEGCALQGKYCNADLSYMGRWSDGRPVRRAAVSTNPVDAGPTADAFEVLGLRGECEVKSNPRRADCPRSSR